MESKKINQLATELAPDLSDLTIIGDPTTGISKKITLSQMASLFTGTVEEYANFAAFPLVGVADTIYVAKDTNVIYRWDSTAYVVLSPNIIASLVFNDANGFDGNISLVGSVATLTITTALTTGSVGFIGASGALLQDNANFFWDDTNNRLGLGTNAPTTALDVFGSGIIGRINGTSTNNAYLAFASAGTNKWSVGNVQSDHRFRIFSEANSAELITILQTGEFGIGIANPTTKFHIDGAASALIANLDANVSVAKSISFRSDNSNRINLEVSGTESGSNAGANFFLRTYTDAGSLLETPFSIVRSTGVTTIKSLTLTNALSVANGGTGITSLTTGYIPFGNGTSAFGNSANLFWDNTNSRLGLGTLVPIRQLSLYGGTIGLYNSSTGETVTDGYTMELSGLNGFLWNYENGSLNFGTNNTSRLVISSTGGASFSSTITAGGSIGVSNSSTVANNNFYLLNSSTNKQWNIVNIGSGISGRSGNFEINNNAIDIFAINQSGFIGIGTTSPSTSLHIVGGKSQLTLDGGASAGAGFLLNTGLSGSDRRNWFIGTEENVAGDFVIKNSTAAGGNANAGTTRIAILSNGNIGFGETAPNARLDIVGVSNAANTYGSLVVRNPSQTGISFGALSTSYTWIQGNIFGSGVADITINPNGGNVLMHSTSFNSTLVGQLFGTTGDTYFTRSANPVLWLNRLSNDGVILTFQKDNSIVGTISTNSNSLPSDLNFKKNISNLQLGLNLITKLRAVSYNHKIDDDDAALSTGFIAQELEQSLTDLGVKENEYYILQHKPNEDAKQSQYWLDYTKMIPVLVKAIQEQQAQIEELKAK